MSKIFKNVKKIPFFICLSFSIILIVVSFIMPPAGKIDSSVIQAVAEIFAFAALYVVIEGMHRGSDVSISKGDVSVQINNPDDKDEDISEG